MTIGLRISVVFSSLVWFRFVIMVFHSPTSYSIIVRPDLIISRRDVADILPTTVFEPGTLKMEKRDAIAKCWTQSPRKQDQRIRTKQFCLYSKDYNVLVNLSGKTGTSTQKRVLQHTMNAEEKLCSTIHDEGGDPLSKSRSLTRVATVREPFDRFLSGYKETLYRLDIYEDHPDYDTIPAEYSRFLTLLRNKSAEEKQAIFKAETPERLQTKTEMFKIFVQDFDGHNAFDRHLNSQSIKLWDHGGEGMAKYDFIMEAANLTQDLVTLAEMVHAPRYPDKEVRARSRSSDRIDVESLPDETIQKICQIFALDYCCLNYPLPPACQRAPPGQRVLCDWVAPPHPTTSSTTRAAGGQIRNLLG